MDDSNVTLSLYLLNKLEEIAFIRLIETTSTKEQAKQTKTFVRAFTKRGVPMKTIMDALIEISRESLKGE